MVHPVVLSWFDSWSVVYLATATLWCHPGWQFILPRTLVNTWLRSESIQEQINYEAEYFGCLVLFWLRDELVDRLLSAVLLLACEVTQVFAVIALKFMLVHPRKNRNAASRNGEALWYLKRDHLQYVELIKMKGITKETTRDLQHVCGNGYRVSIRMGQLNNGVKNILSIRYS